MSLDLALILLMLAAAIVMFVINRPRMDAVALLVMVSMPFTGIITVNEALAGFADPSIILIAALFVIGEGLVRTGVARRLGDWLDAKAGSSENRLLILLMAALTAASGVWVLVDMPSPPSHERDAEQQRAPEAELPDEVQAV